MEAHRIECQIGCQVDAVAQTAPRALGWMAGLGMVVGDGVVML